MLVFGYENFIFGYINFIISKIVENREIIVTVNCFYFDRIIIIFNIFIIQIRNAEKNGSQTCPGDDPPVRRHLSHSARGTWHFEIQNCRRLFSRWSFGTRYHHQRRIRRLSPGGIIEKCLKWVHDPAFVGLTKNLRGGICPANPAAKTRRYFNKC